MPHPLSINFGVDTSSTFFLSCELDEPMNAFEGAPNKVEIPMTNPIGCGNERRVYEYE